jgi:hypothetical protein
MKENNTENKTTEHGVPAGAVDFVKSGAQKRELYFWENEILWLRLPKGKVLRVTFDYVSESKLKNVGE